MTATQIVMVARRNAAWLAIASVGWWLLINTRMTRYAFRVRRVIAPLVSPPKAGRPSRKKWEGKIYELFPASGHEVETAPPGVILTSMSTVVIGVIYCRSMGISVCLTHARGLQSLNEGRTIEVGLPNVADTVSVHSRRRRRSLEGRTPEDRGRTKNEKGGSVMN